MGVITADYEVIESARKESLDLLKKDAEQTYNNYETMLNERYDGTIIDESNQGLARELARMNLTLNTYTPVSYTHLTLPTNREV